MTARMFEDDSEEELNSEMSDDEDEEDDIKFMDNEQDDDSGSEDDNAQESDVEEEQESKSKKKKSKNKSKLSKLLNEDVPGGVDISLKEINKLKETEDLYNSNLYRFQIQELISEVTVKTKKKLLVEKWVNELSTYADNLVKSESFSLGEYKNWLGTVKLPLPEKIHPAKLAKGTFEWMKPASIIIVGSWHHDVALCIKSPVDISIEMPKEFFNVRDYLDHKYHAKRAMYLAYLAIQLQERGDKVKFTFEGGNTLKPLLKITEKHFTVLIHAIPPSDYFKPTRLSPILNNLRFEHFTGVALPPDEPEYNTPNYNFSIASDLLMKSEQLLAKRTLEKSTNMKDALKMLKVWLHQRSLNNGYGGFSGHIMTMFVCYLASKNKINGMMSSYQLIRIVFNNLATMDWTTAGITLNSETNITECHMHFDVVFLNESGHMNYTANMSKLTYRRIQYEAKQALTILNGAHVSGFHALFITKIPFLNNFDHILQWPSTERLEKVFKENKDNDRLFLNHSNYFYPIGVSLIGELLEKTLGKRVQLIDVELPQIAEWDSTESPPNSSSDHLRFGILINREAALKQVEKCESEDGTIMSEFKELWGEKSELRRFKDGTISETVVFNEKGLESRICYQMLKYTLLKHLSIKLSDNNIHYLDNQLEKSIEPGYLMVKLVDKKKTPKFSPFKPKRPRISDLEEQHVPVYLDEIANLASKSFDELSKTLRALEGLPLSITSVQGTSSILRFSNVYPTPPQRFYSSALLTDVAPETQCMTIKTSSKDPTIPKCPKYVEPIGVMVHLESSGQWPDDLQAIENLKCAFMIRIGTTLKNQFGLTTQVYRNHVDIIKDGFIFRVRLTYYREVILLKQLQGLDGILKIRDNPKSLLLEKETLILPQLTSTLHSLHRQFEAYGKTCRLAKRWISSQLLLASPLQYDKNFDVPDGRFTEESIELIVAHLFLYFSPHLSPPGEPQTGFIRFLHLLSTMDWNSTPMILNFNDKMNKDEISKIESIFSRKRETFPSLFISTPEDKFGSVWSKNIQLIIIQRGAALAKQALTVITSTLTHPLNKNAAKHLDAVLKGVFRPTTSHFDVIIWIKRDMDARKTQTIEDSSEKILKFKEYIKGNDELMPIVDFDPIQHFLHELRSAFGHLALFLHDLYGGSFVAVVWKPEASTPQLLRKNANANGTKIVNEGKTVIDTDAVLDGIQLIGTGIIDHLEAKKHES